MSAPALPADATFRRADGAIDADVGGQTVMLDAEAGSYFGLNATATHIWGLLAEPRTVAEVAADLPRHFAVAPAAAAAAAEAFLADLAARGFIERVDG